MIEIVGYVGSTLLTICTIPQVIKILQTKQTKDLSLTTFILWLLGETTMLTYATIQTPTIPLIINYGLGAIVAAITVTLTIKYRNRN